MQPVVTLSRPAPHVAVVEMADRAGSNLLTHGLVAGLLDSFAQIESDADTRVVVIHGYNSIFCTGGTQEELLSIAAGQLRFDDIPLYRLLLDCEVPVIAAMQGHALGGGFVFGLYADIVILSEESVYSTNFMKYGFTPGMGATCVVPAKLGPALASEMLFTAKYYRGRELSQRGVPFPVYKRGEVIPAALRLARDIAEKPLVSLKLLKRNLTGRLAAELPEAVRAEIEMHTISFAQPEVRQRIEQLFGV